MSKKYTILVCGYGKIGTIKAALWRQLGAVVYVYDKSVASVGRAQKDGYVADSLERLSSRGLPQNCIIDISVPAGWHIAALRDALRVCGDCPAVLIEKPIASRPEELAELQQLRQESGDMPTLFLDESYYVSQGLAKMKAAIQERVAASSIARIDVDFFKNRVLDVYAGRFTDEYLGAYGVEVSHMLACLKYLGFDQGRLVKNQYYTNVLDESASEGVLCEYKLKDVSIRLTEILGPFRIHHETGDFLPHADPAPVRRVVIAFRDGSNMCLEFDPVPGIQRYRSRLTTTVNGATQSELIADSHLQNMLKCVLNYPDKHMPTDVQRLAGIETAIQEARKLFNLRRSAEVIQPTATTLQMVG